MDPLTVELCGRLATDYLDAASLEKDMEIALELLDDLSKRPAPADPENDGRRVGLWTAIVILYARCFGPGRRQFQADQAVPRQKRLARIHLELMTHRNTDVAHLDPDSDIEPGIVVAFLAPIEEPRAVADVAYEASRFVTPGPEYLERVREVLGQALIMFRLHAHARGQRLLEAARAYPIDKFYTAAANDGSVSIQRDRPAKRPRTGPPASTA